MFGTTRTCLPTHPQCQPSYQWIQLPRCVFPLLSYPLLHAFQFSCRLGTWARGPAVHLMHDSIGTLWFSIWLQLFLILGIIYMLPSDSIVMHCFQIVVFGSVSIVFAVISINQSIFANVASLDDRSWLAHPCNCRHSMGSLFHLGRRLSHTLSFQLPRHRRPHTALLLPPHMHNLHP